MILFFGYFPDFMIIGEVWDADKVGKAQLSLHHDSWVHLHSCSSLMNKKNLKVLALLPAVSHGMLQIMLRRTQQNHRDPFLSQSGRTPQPDYRLIIVHENQEQDWTKGPTMVH